MKTSCDQGLGGSIPIFDKGNQGEFRKKSLKGLLVGLMGLAVTEGVVAEEGEAHGYWQQSAVNSEAFVDEPMPQGVSVKVTEFDGPVFTNREGKTLYTWPLKGLRNGDVGDRVGATSTCTDQIQTTSSGLMSPYPEGLILPDLEIRPSCSDLWPPVLASVDDVPLGKWTTIERENGDWQWAYEGYPAYTSVLDKKPGDTYGGSKRSRRGDGPALRVPIGPAADVPAEFQVTQVANGRMLTIHTGYAVYASDNDAPGKSNCTAECLDNWSPVLAPENAHGKGDWAVVERGGGVLQWAYRGEPLYIYNNDSKARSMIGSDVPGWHNVYTQKAPAPPAGFTVQDTRSGQVLADSEGKTIYIYNCGDDAPDQLFCDHPDFTQSYRLAICGGGDPQRCLAMFPPVPAPGEVETGNRLWGTRYIDLLSGYPLEPGAEGGQWVWTFRDRPIYTFALDQKAGDINADNWGEFNGWRNGYKAFWLRDDFYNNTL